MAAPKNSVRVVLWRPRGASFGKCHAPQGKTENPLLSLDKLHIFVCRIARPIQKNGKIQKFQAEHGRRVVRPNLDQPG